MFCPKCGAQISPNVKFCPKCGCSIQKFIPIPDRPVPKKKTNQKDLLISRSIVVAVLLIVSLLPLLPQISTLYGDEYSALDMLALIGQLDTMSGGEELLVMIVMAFICFALIWLLSLCLCINACYQTAVKRDVSLRVVATSQIIFALVPILFCSWLGSQTEDVIGMLNLGMSVFGLDTQLGSISLLEPTMFVWIELVAAALVLICTVTGHVSSVERQIEAS